MAMGFVGGAALRDFSTDLRRGALVLRCDVLARGMRFLGDSVATVVRCNRLAHVAGFCERGYDLLQKVYRSGRRGRGKNQRQQPYHKGHGEKQEDTEKDPSIA